MGWQDAPIVGQTPAAKPKWADAPIVGNPKKAALRKSGPIYSAAQPTLAPSDSNFSFGSATLDHAMAGVADLAGTIGTLLPDAIVEEGAPDKLHHAAQMLRQRGAETATQSSVPGAGIVSTAAGQLATTIPLLWAGSVGAPAIFGLQQYSSSLTEGRDAGLSPAENQRQAIARGGIEAGTTWAFNIAGKFIPGLAGLDDAAVFSTMREGVKKTGVRFASEIAEENAIALQDAVVQKLSGVNLQALDDPWQIIADTTALTAVTMGLAEAPRATSSAAKALGLGYKHTPEYAREWAQTHPTEAQELQKRVAEGKPLSRTAFAALGLPASKGEKQRKEFAEWAFQPVTIPPQDAPQAETDAYTQYEQAAGSLAEAPSGPMTVNAPPKGPIQVPPIEQPKPGFKKRVEVNLSAATPDLPVLKELQSLSQSGNEQATSDLNKIAERTLRSVLGDAADVESVEQGTGLFFGETEPSIKAVVNVPADRETDFLHRLSKTADAIKQQQIHVTEDTEDEVGKEYKEDGSYVTPAFRIELNRPLSRDEINDVIAYSGLPGLKFSDKALEAYYVRNPEQSAEQFVAAFTKASERLGARGGAISQGRKRLRPYGKGLGAIPFPGGQETDGGASRARAEAEGVGAESPKPRLRPGRRDRSFRDRPKQPGAGTAVGVHYSHAERERLLGEYYGTGIKGAERKRLANSEDLRIKRRVYLYAQEGDKLPEPESGLGAIPHTVRLDNIYVHGVSPRDGLVFDGDNNHFESSVIDAGYDGYQSNGMIVLLDTKPVPVRKVKQAGPETSTSTTKRGFRKKQPEDHAASIEARERPVWKDNILEALKEWQAKGTPQQLLKHLEKYKGAKDEAAWIGLDDFLKGKQAVTKAEVEEFVRANQVEIQEVTKGDGPTKERYEVVAYDLDDEGRESVSARYDRLSDAVDAADELNRTRPRSKHEVRKVQRPLNPPKYEAYTLPGGKDYREMLLTLPVLSQKTPEGPQYKSGHWEEPNILAHVRFDSRTDQDGKKVLFIQEIQSDWHQQGREQGYSGTIDVAKAKEMGFSVYKTTSNLGTEAYFLDGPYRDVPNVGYDTEESAWRQLLKYLEGKQQSVPDAPFKKTWPMLAFKRMVRYAADNGFDRIAWTTGDQQAERYDLSKQVSKIEYDPERGELYAYDKNRSKVVDEEVAPTVEALAAMIGKEPAEKLVQKIQEYPPDPEETIKEFSFLEYDVEKDEDGLPATRWAVIGPHGDEWSDDHYSEDDARESVMSMLEEERRRAPLPTLRNLDLKVGGEGMKAFYDKILPAEVDKFAKKFGAKTGETKIEVTRSQKEQEGSIVRVRQYREVADYEREGYIFSNGEGRDVTADEARQAIESGDVAVTAYLPAKTNDRVTVHSLDVTPEMQAKADEGLEMFASIEGGQEPEQPKAGLRRKMRFTKKRWASWAGSGPETQGGGKLLREQKQPNTKVGERTMAEFLADAVSAMMVRTKSQLNKATPGKYLGGVKDRSGKFIIAPLHHIWLRSEAGYWHELGHAFSTTFAHADPTKYTAWVKYWEPALEQLANSQNGLSSRPGSTEEGLAEAIRLYVTDQGRLDVIKIGNKSFLKGMEEILSALTPAEYKAIRDAHRLYATHLQKPYAEQARIHSADQGYTPPLSQRLREGSREALEKFLTGIFGSSATIDRTMTKAFETLSQTKQSGLHSMAGLWKLANPFTPKAVKQAYKQSLDRAAQAETKLAEEIGDLRATYNTLARTGLEVQRILQPTDGQKGVRVMGSAHMLQKAFGKHWQTIAFRMKQAGIPINAVDTKEGEYYYFTDRSGKVVKGYGDIKQEVGEKNWAEFEKYGQYRTVLNRYRTYEKRKARGQDVEEPLHPMWMEHPIRPDPKNPGASVQELVQEYERTHPEWKDRYKDVQLLFDSYLGMAALAGEVTPREAIRMKRNHFDYWPLGRIQRGDVGEGRLDPREIAQDFKKQQGSDLPFRPLDETAYGRTEKALRAFNYTRLFKTHLALTRRMAKLEPDLKKKVAWMRTFIPLKVDLKAVEVRPDEEAKIIADGINRLEAKKLGLSLSQYLKQYGGVEPQDVAISTPHRVLWREAAPNIKEHVMSIVQGHTKHYYYVPSPLDIDIYTAQERPFDNLPAVAATFELLGKAIKPFSRVVTRSLPFAAMNTFFRDPQTALLSGRGKRSLIPMLYLYNGLRAVVRRDVLGTATPTDLEGLSEHWNTFANASMPIRQIHTSFARMLKEGVTEIDGVPMKFKPSEVGLKEAAKSWVGAAASVILKPFDAVNWASGGWYLSPRGEALGRIGAYIDAVNNNRTQEQAVAAGDNSTANFNQRGNSILFGLANMQAMFLSARQQVAWSFYRQLRDPDPRVRGLALAKLPYIAGLHSLLLASLYTALYAIGDDEEKEELKEWLKTENDRTDSDKLRMGRLPMLDVKIPFDDGLPGMFASMGWNATLKAMNKENPAEEAAKIAGETITNLGPSVSQWVNPYVRTAVEVKLNYNLYYGEQIVPPGVASLHEPRQQTLPSTPGVYNWAAENLANVSPLKIRHVVSNIGMKALDQTAAYYDKKVPQEKSNLPILGSLFAKEPRGWSSQPVKELNEFDARFEAAKNDLKKLAGTDPERAAQAMQSMQELAGYRAGWSQVEALWRQAKAYRKAGNMDLAVQREREMTLVARRILNQLNPEK